MRPPTFLKLDPLSAGLRSVLRDSGELKKPQWRDLPGLEGLCYVSAEVNWHLRGGRSSGLTPMVRSRNGESHWWLEDGRSRILDLNAWRVTSYRDFRYWEGHRQNFLTPSPSRRAEIVIGRLSAKHPGLVPDLRRP